MFKSSVKISQWLEDILLLLKHPQVHQPGLVIVCLPLLPQTFKPYAKLKAHSDGRSQLRFPQTSASDACDFRWRTRKIRKIPNKQKKYAANCLNRCTLKCWELVPWALTSMAIKGLQSSTLQGSGSNHVFTSIGCFAQLNKAHSHSP